MYMENLLRRTLLKYGLIGLASTVSIMMHNPVNAKKRFSITPDEIEGPFYPVTRLNDQDYDLTHIHGRSESARGEHILITGSVRDIQGRPVKQARLDIWQANAAGRYRHPYDPNPAPIDPNFQGSAIIMTGTDGMFQFKTVMPGAYPAEKNWIRPPHIHFKVEHEGYLPLVTQMYFPDNSLNANDLLLNSKSLCEQALMIARKKGPAGGLEVYEYSITLQRT